MLKAHEIATQARASIFELDPCIDDATVHVDAQPLSLHHGGEQQMMDGDSTYASKGGVEGLKVRLIP